MGLLSHSKSVANPQGFIPKILDLERRRRGRTKEKTERGRGRVNSNGGEGTAGALLPSNQFFGAAR